MQAITTTEWLVILGGIAAIAWVNWYFFLAGRTTPPPPPPPTHEG